MTLAVLQAEALEELSGRLEEVMPLLDANGLVLARGLEPGLQAFENFTRAICTRFHNVATRQANKQLAGDHYTTNVMSRNYALLGHTESSYRPHITHPPEVAFFLGITPPCEPGGETSLVDGCAFYEALPKALQVQLEEGGVIYEILWDKARWQCEFDVETVEELAALLKTKAGVTFSIEQDMLHMRYHTRAVISARNGRKAFANAMLAHLPYLSHPNYQGKNLYTKPHNRLYFGNGEALSDAVVNKLVDIHDAIAYLHVWQRGDLVMLDNSRYLHGRTMTARDCERVIISRFGWL